MAAKTWEQHKAECEAAAKPGLKILGWIGEWKGCYTLLEIECEKHGVWSSTCIANFKHRGGGCPDCHKETTSRVKGFSEEHYIKEISSLATERGFTFLGWSEPYKKAKTKCVMVCPNGHTTETIQMDNFKGGQGCKLCQIEKMARSQTKTDGEHIADFMATGRFLPGTIFTKERRGYRSYWSYICPVCSNDEYVSAKLCSGVFNSCESSLKIGTRTCRCSDCYHFTKEQQTYRLKKLCEDLGYTFIGFVKSTAYGIKDRFKYLCEEHGVQEVCLNNFINSNSRCPSCVGKNQLEGYINAIYDGELPVALKFGIATASTRRVREQNRKSAFEVRNLATYLYPNAITCKAAEAACKEVLECGVVSKEDMPDGWTETVALTDYDKVVSIYERFGGVRVDTNINEGGDNV